MVSGASVDFLQQILPPSGPLVMAATRFAPSPNGQLHLGHAWSALCAHDFAAKHGGAFQLRIEDIDGTRSRPEYVDGIITDMQWLGLDWNGPVRFQSANVERYKDALDQLHALGLIYRCRCTRSDIAAAVRQHPVPHGPDGPVYPGTCRGQVVGDDEEYSWRLDMEKAVAFVRSPLPFKGGGRGWVRTEGEPEASTTQPSLSLERGGLLYWTDLAVGPQHADPALFGDVIIWRKDAPASYHLAATVDDAADGISHVVRGQDLFAYTAIHRLLQQLLGLPEPVYWHHPLLLDESGEKLAKSKASTALSLLREAGQDGPTLIEALRRGEVPLGISLSNA